MTSPPVKRGEPQSGTSVEARPQAHSENTQQTAAVHGAAGFPGASGRDWPGCSGGYGGMGCTLAAEPVEGAGL